LASSWRIQFRNASGCTPSSRASCAIGRRVAQSATAARPAPATPPGTCVVLPSKLPPWSQWTRFRSLRESEGNSSVGGSPNPAASADDVPGWQARKPDCRWGSAADLAVGCLPVTAVAAVPGGWPVADRHPGQRPGSAVYLVNFTDDHGATSRAIVAMSSSRSMCSPGSNQDAPRSRGMSSSTPRPTRPSLRASMPRDPSDRVDPQRGDHAPRPAPCYWRAESEQSS
jgi:hypothetical protein